MIDILKFSLEFHSIIEKICVFIVILASFVDLTIDGQKKHPRSVKRHVECK